MEKRIKGFTEYINEYWTSVAPGTVVVPGEWGKDGVKGKNYRPVNTTMPTVIDPMFEDEDLDNIIETMKKDSNILDRIRGTEDPAEVLDLVREFIRKGRKKKSD